DGISVTLQATNMVFLQYQETKPVTEFVDALYRQGVNICPGEQIRLVLHKNVTREDCVSVVAAIKNAL
ncbi:MAG: low-specificity L-threonine aldolase, partial [Pseudoalteromonas spongiae]